MATEVIHALPPAFRLMTYNTHRCVGIDRRHSPTRIAEVIAEFAPDVVALQELVVGVGRSGAVDHPRAIAERLGYDFQFQPARQIGGIALGNAILSRLPMRHVHSGHLPAHPLMRRWGRSALWTAVRVGGRDVQVVNAHLSLIRAERVRQAEALVGTEWLAHPECRSAHILCGDMNATRRCPSYRRMAGSLTDAQLAPGGSRHHTWPSVFPFRPIDHVFVSHDIAVRCVAVPSTRLTRRASDHLPLIVDVELRAVRVATA